MRALVKDYKKGFVPRDGNGMVGGRWWGCKRLGYASFGHLKYLGSVIDDDRLETLLKWFKEKTGGEEFKVEAYIEVGSDESVGLPNICDLDEVLPVDEGIYQAIHDCPFLDALEKGKVRETLGRKLEDLEAEDFELYEID